MNNTDICIVVVIIIIINVYLNNNKYIYYEEGSETDIQYCCSIDRANSLFFIIFVIMQQHRNRVTKRFSCYCINDFFLPSSS